MGLIVGLILLILLFPPFFAFGWKIHAAYDFARREEHRATPRPLGDFFWHELRRTTWKLGLAWVLLVLLLGLILQVRVIEGDKPLPVPYWFAFVQFLFPTAYMLAALVTQIAFALRMLPVMRARAMFAAGSAILAIALPLGLYDRVRSAAAGAAAPSFHQLHERWSGGESQHPLRSGDLRRSACLGHSLAPENGRRLVSHRLMIE